MISYSRDSNETIPASAVKIIGLGGAGANMLERIALDTIDGAELLALNTDIRTLGACLAKAKIQLGVNLTKGLGTGGDPELGQQAMLEAEDKVREALKGQQIVFLCTGLGGGTGSGAAPIVARIAREEGAFVVVFATMPFFFEGRRRRDQAETSLNQLAVLSNALVTFDNNRMGELVLAKQGIHEAFAAADRMISESIKAVIRLVIRPGLINVGLDDLMSALRTTRSRCLFGSGMADGKDRAAKALRNALSSPLLDQGSLLKDAQTVLVHLSGGETLTLFEIELLMQNLQKYVPEKAHVLFGAAIDPAMGDNLSITLISALPEDALTGGTRDSISTVSKTIADLDSSNEEERKIENPFSRIDTPTHFPEPEIAEISEPDDNEIQEPEPESVNLEEAEIESPKATTIPAPRKKLNRSIGDNIPSTDKEEFRKDNYADQEEEKFEAPEAEKEERPFAEPQLDIAKRPTEPEPEPQDEAQNEENFDEIQAPNSSVSPAPGPKTRSTGKPLWGRSKSQKDEEESIQDPFEEELTGKSVPEETTSGTQLKLDSKYPGSQSELSFESAPRGRFEGENPNVFEGEDLDLPPFLRKKKS
jgi:cell division protein FtsZ